MRDQVYFLRQRGVGGLVKIGCSKEPKCRIQHIAPWSPFPLEIAAVMDGNYILERRFHALFAAQHVGREWFTATPELEQVMADINGGTFDVETLPAPKNVTTNRGINRKRPYITTVHDDGFVEVAQLRFIPLADLAAPFAPTPARRAAA